MINLHLHLDTRRKLKDGTYPLKIYVRILNKGRFLLSLGVSVKINEWDGRQVIKNPRRNILNSVLKHRFNKVEDEIYKIELSGELDKINLKQLKIRLTSSFKLADNTNLYGEDMTLLKTSFVAFANSSKSEGTKNIYLQTLAKLSSTFDIETLRFDDITTQWLREWEKSMLNTGMKVNAIAVHMRNLRAVFNRAIDDNHISQNLYPFRRFKITCEKTQKRAITVEQLRLLLQYPCEEWQVRYRDYFMLIFYLIGINTVDLYALNEITGGRVEYRRAKTKRLYSIKVEPEALKIIENYKGKRLLLDIADRYANSSDFRIRLNRSLKTIGSHKMVENNASDPKNIKKNKKVRTAILPEITSYTARHTWATIAAQLDIPKETIAAALGHGGNSVTDVYIDFDRKKIDEANRKVIDYIFADGVAVNQQ